MTGVELTRRVPCATCDGLGKRLVIEPQKTYERQCKDCTDGHGSRGVQLRYLSALESRLLLLKDRHVQLWT